MAKVSRGQPKVADKQLAGVHIGNAKRKWREGLPVTLKEMAVALELGYSTVRQYGRIPGFPMLKGNVFPRLFDLWLEECFRAQSSGAPPALEDDGEMVPRKNSTVRLPMQAQRLLADAGIRK
jgi:hypothetical protein